MAQIGHNKGPTLATGNGWQTHCWRRARQQLLPTLPIEVVRLRLKRAAEIGLDYKTYASIRATTGQDVIALLFSTNALRMLKPGAQLPADRRDRLAAVTGTGRGALTLSPVTPEDLLKAVPTIDHAAPAPQPFAAWPQTRQAVQALLAQGKWPADRVVLIGDTMPEGDWVPAARLAWYVPADRYFAA